MNYVSNECNKTAFEAKTDLLIVIESFSQNTLGFPQKFKIFFSEPIMRMNLFIKWYFCNL